MAYEYTGKQGNNQRGKPVEWVVDDCEVIARKFTRLAEYTARKRAPFGQEVLGARVGLTRTQINRILNGKVLPTKNNRAALHDALDNEARRRGFLI